MSPQAGHRKGNQKDLQHKNGAQVAGLKMKETMCEDQRVASGTESDPMPMPSMEKGTSALQPHRPEFCQWLNEPLSEFPPQSFHRGAQAGQHLTLRPYVENPLEPIQRLLTYRTVP